MSARGRCEALIVERAAMALAELANGQRGVITGTSVSGEHVDAAAVRRLNELGFLPGEPVHVLRRGPGGREPIVVQVGDTLFALRRVEAQCIDVQLASTHA